jgi:hypothetical protein
VDNAKSAAVNFLFKGIPDSALLPLLGIDSQDPKYMTEVGEYDYNLFDQDKAAAVDKAKRDFFSYEGIKPGNSFEKYAGIGLGAAIEEGPLAVAGGRGAFGLAAEALHSIAQSSLGAVVSDSGTELGQDLGMSEGGSQAFGTGLSVASGFLYGAGRLPMAAGIEAGQAALKTKADLAGTAEKAENYVANSQVKAILDSAVSVQPNMKSVVDNSVELEKSIPNLKLAPGVVLADNPIINKNLTYLNQKFPEFRAKFDAMQTASVAARDKLRLDLFGERGEGVNKNLRLRLAEETGIKVQAAEKRIQAIDTQLSKATARLQTSQDSTDVGVAVRNMMKAKEAAVRSSLQPQYDYLLKSAEASGVRLGADSAERLHSTIRQLKADDVFANHPTLAAKAERIWGPVRPSTARAGGRVQLRSGPRLPDKPVFNTISVKDMDSFKRSLNKAIRETDDLSETRKLYALKDAFKAEVDQLPDNFGAKYSALDMDYYKQLGVPLSSAGIRSLDSGRFETSVATALAKPEQAREFLNFVGESGVPVVRNAVLIQMTGKNSGVLDAEGNLSPRKLEQFLRVNERLVDTVPNLRAEINDTRNFIETLTTQRADIDAAFSAKSRQMSDGFYQAMESNSLSGVVSSMLKSPQKSDFYFRDVDKFDPDTAKMLTQGVRAELLQKGIDSDITMNDFVAKNKNVYDQWFGPAYAKDLKVLADASSILGNYSYKNMSFNQNMREVDGIAKLTGINAASWVSVLRDRIMSVPHQIMTLGSRMQVAKAAAKRDGALMDIMLDPKKLATLTKSLTDLKLDVDVGSVSPETIKRLSLKTMTLFGKGVYFAEAGAQGLDAYDKEKQAREEE